MIIGLGLDVVDVDRARRLLGRFGDRLLTRLCTEAEIAYIRSHVDGAAQLAARIAAKEAAFKALSGTAESREIGWREIEVVAADNGRPPAIRFHGRGAQRVRELRVEHVLLTMSHSDRTAAAVVLLEGHTNNVE